MNFNNYQKGMLILAGTFAYIAYLQAIQGATTWFGIPLGLFMLGMTTKYASQEQLNVFGLRVSRYVISLLWLAVWLATSYISPLTTLVPNIFVKQFGAFYATIAFWPFWGTLIDIGNKKFAGAGTIFIKDGKVLTVFRNNTAKNNNKHGLIGGRCETNETVKACAIREAFEEVGITVKPEDLQLVHTIHSKENNEEVLGFYFVATTWEGEPYNKDTSKHERIEWFSIDSLPEDLIPRNRQAIECWQKGVTYSEYGWK